MTNMKNTEDTCLAFFKSFFAIRTIALFLLILLHSLLNDKAIEGSNLVAIQAHSIIIFLSGLFDLGVIPVFISLSPELFVPGIKPIEQEK